MFPPADDAGRVVYTKATYDNLDRAVKQERYLEISGADDRLLARSETFYDDRSRVYQTKRYAVNVDTGAVGNALVSNTWYDAAGNTIKQQSAGSQAFTKTVYDSLGRAVKQYVGHDTDETAYADASSVSDDTIVEQVETAYDDAGNVLQTTSSQRFHNATGTGELTSPSGSQPKARVTYVAMYHDEIGRQIAVANYGTYGGATFDRAGVLPSRTDTILVTSTEYNNAGQAYKTVDPAGREDRQVFDDAGRVVKTIQNYVDGVVSAAASDEDVTVEMTYNADGNLETLTAKNPTTRDQTTTYVYGTTLSDSEIATSTLKRAEIYPDSDDTVALGDGADGTYDRIEFKYDRQQRVTQVKDQQQTVHAFDFDALGRPTQDRVTALGSGVDGAVRRIATTYDILSRREKITSYDNPTVGSGSIVNEVQFAYDDFGQLVTEYQEHGGAVNTSTSLKVGYSYADGSSNTIRMTKMTYPDGRELNYDYGSSGSTDDALSRVASLIDNDGSTHLVDYSYLGRQTFVQTDYREPDLRYDLAMGAGDDPYDGFDRFGRVVDNRWYDYGSSVDADRILYGYDRANNRTYREQTCDSNSYHDEVYGHDSVNRLTTFDRGTINGNKDAISTFKFAQQWNLDPTGNWSGFKEDSDGDSTWDLEQTRTSNEVSEITDITGTSGTAWATPVYNRAGNMTTIPKPGDPTSTFAATYDAWNRLVKLEDGDDTVSEYVHDAAKRRVVQRTYDSGELDKARHFYHSARWQVVEERLESGGTISANPDRQFAWGLRYIDDLVLRDRDTDANGCLNERLYALQDANWNVTALVDTSGDVQERYVYSAYGTPNVLTSTFTTRASSSYGSEVLYAGYRYEQATAVYHIRHRVYQPDLGSWTQRDPIGPLGGINVYRYISSAPLIQTDHLALAATQDSEDPIWFPLYHPENGLNRILLYSGISIVANRLDVVVKIEDLQYWRDTNGGSLWKTLSGTAEDRDSAQIAIAFECVDDSAPSGVMIVRKHNAVLGTPREKAAQWRKGANQYRAFWACRIPPAANRLRVAIVYTDIYFDTSNSNEPGKNWFGDMPAIMGSWEGRRMTNRSWDIQKRPGDMTPALAVGTIGGHAPTAAEMAGAENGVRKVLGELGFGLQNRVDAGTPERNTGFDLEVPSNERE